jgi:hypothetical protein
MVPSGLMRVTRSESSRRETDISICEPGDIFGEHLPMEVVTVKAPGG